MRVEHGLSPLSRQQSVAVSKDLYLNACKGGAYRPLSRLYIATVISRFASYMAKKRQLNPQSVWDAAALEAAFADAGVKSSRVQALYRYIVERALNAPPSPAPAALPRRLVRVSPRLARTITAEQMRRYLLKHPDAGWADVPDLPKAAAELLSRDFVKCTSRVVQCQHSSDGETSKLLLELQDGLQVEAVIMRYDTTGETEGACLLGACFTSAAQRCHSIIPAALQL